ncbi:hypothetical protein KA107_02190 [Candidatus Pacearchaeota archaeon]|nr:hypothetical protein [Candidatus Pacearchaeota archaeon]
MDKNLILEVKKKREFTELPDSLVEKALFLNKNDVKSTRAFLRKYFGVFLTNKVVKNKILSEGVLKSHISSRKRDYSELYSKILTHEKTIIDLGCGVNGFSYYFLKEVLHSVKYLGFEASGQLVGNMNLFFAENQFNATALHLDLFNLDEISNILEKQEKPRTVFLFQVIDALEKFEKNFSKKLLLVIAPLCEKIVLSYSLKSISGKSTFQTNRNWIKYFVEEHFQVIEELDLFDEHFIVLSYNKK